MKIHHLIIDGGSGGAETFLSRLARALQARGHPQHVILTANAPQEEYMRRHDVPHTVLDFGKLSKPFSLLKMRRIVNRERPDAIVAWMSRSGRNIPRGRHLTVGRLGNRYKIDNFKRCDLIVGNSPDLVEFAIQGGRPDARLITNFIELSPFPPIDRSHIRRPLLLACARLNPAKGFDVLLHALTRLDAHLWIAGVGKLREELESLAIRLGVADRVEFLGWRSDVPALLAAADVFVFPSRWEGTSNSLLEAAAAAKPIVTTSGLSVSWFLEHEKSALIVPVDDEEALARAVQRLVSEPNLGHQLGLAAQRIYQSTFSEDAVCDQWIKTLAEAIEAKAAASSLRGS
ncbi:glycosyltransferase [Consotaella salsifontis]|uniref:Glycosyltransferase involved in cell wall bisynthesis n=1 Tax=Consotaella salsifontis TaxID=1365950 RepID=A0A1T4R7Q7_9HYPH|nr:glycosyltransferase [Consotaella salsifontis]SKA11945.1 Glycosyltransferase involved in cell wall bisynthesis [Consotaella salsifontis]